MAARFFPPSFCRYSVIRVCKAFSKFLITINLPYNTQIILDSQNDNGNIKSIKKDEVDSVCFINNKDVTNNPKDINKIINIALYALRYIRKNNPPINPPHLKINKYLSFKILNLKLDKFNLE